MQVENYIMFWIKQGVKSIIWQNSLGFFFFCVLKVDICQHQLWISTLKHYTPVYWWYSHYEWWWKWHFSSEKNFVILFSVLFGWGGWDNLKQIPSTHQLQRRSLRICSSSLELRYTAAERDFWSAKFEFFVLLEIVFFFQKCWIFKIWSTHKAFYPL